MVSTLIAQAQVKVDESNLVTQLLSIGAGTPAQADGYFIGKKYKLVSKSEKKLGDYTGEVSKYKIADSTDSYGIIALKEKIINSMYISYSKTFYLKTLDDAAKMGFKPTEAATPDAAQTVYSRGDERFIVRVASVKSVKDKTFYVFSASNLVLTSRAMAEAKGQ